MGLGWGADFFQPCDNPGYAACAGASCWLLDHFQKRVVCCGRVIYTLNPKPSVLGFNFQQQQQQQQPQSQPQDVATFKNQAAHVS